MMKMGKLPVRLPSYGGGELAYHAGNEATDVGATTTTATVYYDVVADGGTIISQSITITKKSMVVVVTLAILVPPYKATDIRRGGVNKTVETIISATNFAISGLRGHLQYAYELLDPGTYTYDLVNTSGTPWAVYGAAMKIVAITVE